MRQPTTTRPLGRSLDMGYPPGCDPQRPPQANGHDCGRYWAAHDWPDAGRTLHMLADPLYLRSLAGWGYRYTPWGATPGPDLPSYLLAWARGYAAGYLAEVQRLAELMRQRLVAEYDERVRELTTRRTALGE